MSEAVVSTRIRLARNLKDYPFPIRLSADKAREVVDKVGEALKDCEIKFHRIDLDNIPDTIRVAMIERHLVSPDFISEQEGRAVYLSDDNTVSIMVNEEDHIRLQVIKDGFELKDAYALADQIDNILSKKLSFAFHERLGYLTQCPTNLGTGMRASVMLHLPALSHAGLMPRLSSTIAKLGLTLRGTYGEGSKPVGELYQLSNQVTLGISEQAAIQNLEAIARQIMEQELQAREALKQDTIFIDRIYRAYGILTSAYMLSCSECTDLLSLVRLGAAIGILDLPLDELTKLLTEIQPATLNVAEGRVCPAAERDVIRAKKVKETLQKAQG